MKHNHNELKAGFFIVISFVLAVGIVAMTKGTAGGPSEIRVVDFKLGDDLSGLREGDDVRVGGFKVGIVKRIEPVDFNGADPRIQVTFTFPKLYELRKDTAVSIQSGLTGATNLNISTFGVGPKLADGEHVVGKPDPKTALLASLGRVTPNIEGAMDQINHQTIPKVNQTVDAAKAMIQHAHEKIDPIVARYNTVADNAGKAAGELGDLMGDTKPDIRGTLKNLNVTMSKLPAIADQVSTVITKVDGSLGTAKTALEDIQKVAANTKDITASARSVIVSNHGKFESIIGSLKTTSDNLKGASIEVRRSPWRLLYKPTESEMSNLNLYDTARQFAEGAGNLSDAATSLRDALRDPNADKVQIQKLVENLDQSFNSFHKVEDKLWTSVKQ
jgi:ABC-type transporter Mla subunit MlaD